MVDVNSPSATCLHCYSITQSIVKCLVSDCGQLEVANATVDITNGTTYGEIVIVSCLEGFLPAGKTPVHCLATGNWSEGPECEIRGTVMCSQELFNIYRNIDGFVNLMLKYIS